MLSAARLSAQNAMSDKSSSKDKSKDKKKKGKAGPSEDTAVPVTPVQPLFGVPIEDAARRSDAVFGAVPLPIRRAVEYLNDRGTLFVQHDWGFATSAILAPKATVNSRMLTTPSV